MNFKPFALAAALLSVTPLHAQAPDPQRIMEGVRIAATLTKLDGPLNGSLTHNRKKTPVALFLKGENIQFQFSEGGGKWRVFHMRLADNAYNLFEMINGKTVNFPRNKLVEPIAGTDLTYEDLSFRFFYWPNPKLEGIEKVGREDCFKIRLNKPRGQGGRYETVYVWVHTKFGAFMRIRGHDARGTLVKEFQVEKVMQVAKDTWTLEKMQVASHDPSSGRRISITDLVFEKPKAGPRGLR